MKHFLHIFLTICSLFFAYNITYAGWVYDDVGWKYQKDPASEYVKSGWHWIDSENTGVARCYFFKENGYILTNAVTPDGYYLNSKGEWVVDGVVQYKILSPQAPSHIVENDLLVEDEYYNLKKWIRYAQGVITTDMTVKPMNNDTWNKNLVIFKENFSNVAVENPGCVGFKAEVSLENAPDFDNFVDYSLVVYSDSGEQIARFFDFNFDKLEIIDVNLSRVNYFTIQLEGYSTDIASNDFNIDANQRRVFIHNAYFYN